MEGLHFNNVVNISTFHWFIKLCLVHFTQGFGQIMERRATRVSEAQWNILLDFLELHPNLARARGYNNSARGRAESARLWQEVANLLNSEGSGTVKAAKDWSTYVSNYKSKLKKIVADINADASATGGGPPQGSSLSVVELRFLAMMGQGFGQTAPRVSVNPFPDEDLQQPSISAIPQTFDLVQEEVQLEEIIDGSQQVVLGSIDIQSTTVAAQAIINPAGPEAPPLPRQTRRTRYCSRPLAPLDEARRILSQIEMQRAAADAASAQALNIIGQNLGILADIAERYFSHIGSQ